MKLVLLLLIANVCCAQWQGSVTLYDRHQTVLKTDTSEVFTELQELSDWIALKAELFTGLKADWNYNTASHRLYKLQDAIYQRDTFYLTYQQSYYYITLK
jgi:hypothetical protein